MPQVCWQWEVGREIMLHHWHPGPPSGGTAHTNLGGPGVPSCPLHYTFPCLAGDSGWAGCVGSHDRRWSAVSGKLREGKSRSERKGLHLVSLSQDRRLAGCGEEEGSWMGLCLLDWAVSLCWIGLCLFVKLYGAVNLLG